MDRLTALTVFRQVALLRSFSGAGRRLGLSPAAVSKNISELEAHLRVRLINRTTRRMSLTEAGAIYLDRISCILDDLDEADRVLGPMQATPSGALRVAAPLTTGLVCLTERVPDFLAHHPDLSLDLELDDRRVDIVGGGYDLAIRGSDSLEDSSLVARKLGVLEHVVCAAPAYFERFGEPAAPEELARHECIRFSLSGHADQWDFRKDGRQVRVSVSGRYSVSSSFAVRDALQAGFGISLVPYIYVCQDLEAGRLRSVLTQWSTVETALYAIYPSSQFLAPKLRAFLDFAAEVFADMPVLVK